MDSQIEIHPWKWFVPKSSKILIIGTFPTAKKNWAYDFFYPNPANRFWDIMSVISSIPIESKLSSSEAVIKRKEILQKLNISLTDMGNKVNRNDGSSLDEKLIIIEYMNIFQILKENPEITKIIFTSSSGKVSALRWFNNYLKEKNILHKFPKGIKPLRSEIILENRVIQLVVLYSPSRRTANRISFDKLIEMYRNEVSFNI